jgi:hypothetical protein
MLENVVGAGVQRLDVAKRPGFLVDEVGAKARPQISIGRIPLNEPFLWSAPS